MLMEGGLGVLVQTKMGLLSLSLSLSTSAITLSLAKNHKFAPPLPCMFGDLFFLFCLQKRTKQADPGIMALYHLMASSNQLK
jgi:hypothetical protein